MLLTKKIETITIIGLGNVGWHLSIALKEAGYEIKNIVSRNPEAAAAIKEIVSAEIFPDISHLKEETDLYLLCVQDSEIESLAATLMSSDRIIAHTSGGTDLSVFNGKDSGYGVFYPLQTFTKGAVISYSDIPFLLEADNEYTLNLLIAVAKNISGYYQCVGAELRLRLHLAAVFACNFSNHMVTIADYLLKKDGLDVTLLHPLMRQTLQKLESLSPLEAQTGPAVRDDVKTINRHLELLSGEPELEELYKAITRNIQNHK